MHVQKKDQPYSLNIWEVNDSEKCDYLNARKILFQKILQESMFSRVLNTADTTMVAPLFERSIDPRQVELENIPVRDI